MKKVWILILCSLALGCNSTQKPILVYSLPNSGHSYYSMVKSVIFSQNVTDQFSFLYQPGNFDQANARGTILVVGLPWDNSLVRELLATTDLALDPEGVTAGDRRYPLDDFNLDLVLPRASAVFILSTSNSWDNILQYNQPYESPDNFLYRISARKGTAVLEEGHLQSRGDRWVTVPDQVSDPGLVTELKKDRKLLRSSLTAAALPLKNGDFIPLLPLVREKEILFLGESPHYEVDIKAFVTSFAAYLSRYEGYKVFGREELYSQILDTEASSPPGLLQTEIDIDHAINHTKSSTVKFFTTLAKRHQDPEHRKKLLAAVHALHGTVSRESLISWVDDLEKVYLTASSGFSPEDQELFTYSLGLERASANFQFYGNGERPADMSLQEANEFRGRYFRENILRAWKKASALGGGLICYVGGAHNILTPFGPSDYPVGRISEARFFAEEHPDTKGKTASLLVAKLDKGLFHTTVQRRLLLELLGDKAMLFVNLKTRGKELSPVIPQYFYEGQPKYDGIILIK